MSHSFSCRSCASSNGSLVLDLGLQPLANNLLRQEDLTEPEPKFPLRLSVCQNSDTLLRHAREAARRYVSDFGLTRNSRVVEIASNDGYLLQNFLQAGIPCLGVEPAANIAEVARKKGIETRVEFFGLESARKLAAESWQADLILGNNVFAHAPDTNDFVAGLSALLRPGGRVVLEFPYGVELIEHSEFDTIYHEHVFYFTLTALRPLFQRHGLEIFRVERLSIHGGSLRLFAGKTGAHTPDPSVAQLLADERRKGVDSIAYYRDFARQVLEIKSSLRALVEQLRGQGKRLAAYGASAKGSTLLNFFGIDGRQLEFVADRSTHKQGRLTPGTHIPILPPEELAARQPDYTLLLTWNFADEILAQQQAYRNKGGQFIIPIPRVRVV